jgi:hypothetical protein
MGVAESPENGVGGIPLRHSANARSIVAGAL